MRERLRGYEKMKDPHQNLFFYYRGPSNSDKKAEDIHVEDNTTKSLINTLEFLNTVELDFFLNHLLHKINVPPSKAISFKLQIHGERSRPDALVSLSSRNIFIESKVQAVLEKDQIMRHLNFLKQNDVLLIITNNIKDHEKVKEWDNQRLRFLTWGEIHFIARETFNSVKKDKKLIAVKIMLKHFIDYLEVATLTEFNGFREEDFDFFVDYNKYYLPILKKKIDSLAESVKQNLPFELNEYQQSFVGNMPKDMKPDNSIWVAIQKKNEPKGNSFLQNNFTLQIDRDGLQINAVIRNGGIENERTPLGTFYKKMQDSTLALKTFKKIAVFEKKQSNKVKFQINERTPRYGDQIRPGNERWYEVFTILIDHLTSENDIKYLCSFLEKIERPNFPGIRIQRYIPRSDPLLQNKEELIKQIIGTWVSFKPFLSMVLE